MYLSLLQTIYRWLVQTVHGDCFSKRKYEHFMRHRNAPGTGVTFAEIEVMLCNIPSRAELLLEEEEEKREEQGTVDWSWEFFLCVSYVIF